MTEHSHSATHCSHCETLPAKTAGPGRLYLWLPTEGNVYAKLTPFLIDLESRYEVLSGEGCVILTLDGPEVQPIFEGLAALLSENEVVATRALFMPGLDEPTAADLVRSVSLKRCLNFKFSEWLLDMLGEGRFVSYFQPIVEAGDIGRVFAHEALLRGVRTDGSLVPPLPIFESAREAGLLHQIDLFARRLAIREAKLGGLDTPIFINFNPASIHDPEACLRSTIEAIDETGIARERIVFEVVESDRAQTPAHLKRILEFYRAEGFAFALDDLGSGYSSLNLIHQLRPEYVKLDMELIRHVDADPYKSLVTGKLLEICDALGIRSIAEGVETPGELAWLQAHGATFIQGFLIAEPAPAASLRRASGTLTARIERVPAAELAVS